MSMIHTDYVLMTINTEKLRVAVGNREGQSSIAYTYSFDSDSEENFYSYRIYLNAFSEDEGKYLQHLVEEKQTRKANIYVSEKLNRSEMIGPTSPVVLSEFVPDEWFDGCKSILNLLEYLKFKGVYPIDHETWFEDEDGEGWEEDEDCEDDEED